MDINELCRKAHKNAINKGFYKKAREKGTLLMLIVSELGEALEADRKNRYANNSIYYGLQAVEEAPEENKINMFETCIKDTFEDELADAVIRIADLAGYLDIDLERHIIAKMKYNETRKEKHGKEY